MRAKRALTAAVAACALAGLAPAAASADYTHSLSTESLRLTGDDASDRLVITRTVQGAIFYSVNGGPPRETGATVTNVAGLAVDAFGGDDEIILDQTNGVLPPLTAAAGDGNDRVVGGAGNDSIGGGPGDDRVTWNPGGGSDLVDGGAGSDLHVFNGSAANENMTLRDAGTDAVLSRAVSGAVTLSQTLRGVEHIQNPLFGGADTFTADDDQAGTGLQTLDVDLGETVVGGAQSFQGSDVNDTGAGGSGNDKFDGGAGDDTWKWSPGLATDDLDGGTGNDRFAVAGTDTGDEFHFRGNPPDSFIVFAVNTEETFTADSFETIAVDGRGGNDRVGPEFNVGDVATFDLQGGPGDDTFEGTGGADILRGGEGNDGLFGRSGDDQLFGDAGTDELSGGAGRDSFACGGLGDSFDATEGETVAADCLPAVGPPAEPAPQPDQPQPIEPAQPGQPATGLPTGFLGFGAPKVKASARGLSVTLRNTHSEAIRLKLSASERIGRGKAARYRAVTKTVAPGARTTIALSAPAALRKKISAALKRSRSGRITRRPSLTIANVDTGGRRTVKPRVSLKRR